MNDKLINLFNAHDKEFFTWLHNDYKYTFSDLSKLPYQAQVGIIEEYLYSKHIGISTVNEKPKVLYYRDDYSVVSSYYLDKPPNPSYLVCKVIAIINVVKNKYLPF